MVDTLGVSFQRDSLSFLSTICICRIRVPTFVPTIQFQVQVWIVALIAGICNSFCGCKLILSTNKVANIQASSKYTFTSLEQIKATFYTYLWGKSHS